MAAPPAWLRPATMALAALALVGLFSTEMSDPDSWWHLRTGQYLMEQRRLPTPDPFAWTTASAGAAYAGEEATRRFNLTHEWLAQVLMHGIHVAGGAAALVLWKALLLAGMCGLAGWLAARRTGLWLWGVIATGATASLATMFAQDRPFLITLLFVPLFMAVFESGRRLWVLVPLAVVWANCHGGFFLGWTVCFAYVAEALVGRREDAPRVLFWSAAAVLASGLNPNGFGVVETLFRYRQSFLTSTLIEWSKPYLWGPPYVFDVLLYAGAAALALSWRKVRIADWVLFGLFAAAALTAFRNMILIGVLSPVLIATYWPWRWKLPAMAAYAAPAAAVIVLTWGVAQGRFFQLRAAEWRYPAGAAQFLRDHRLDARLFNTYEYGGYLIWRGERVFIDGRALSETVYQDYRKILGADHRDPVRAATLEKYGIGAILLNGYEYTTGTLYPLVLALLTGMPEWKLAYEDAQAMVFLRHPPPGMAEAPRARIVEHLMAECTLHVEGDPEFSLCARDLGFRLRDVGYREGALRMLRLYLDHPYMDDPKTRAAYQQLLTAR